MVPRSNVREGEVHLQHCSFCSGLLCLFGVFYVSEGCEEFFPSSGKNVIGIFMEISV